MDIDVVYYRFDKNGTKFSILHVNGWLLCMPYLDSKIDKHKKNCGNPVGKRLYIRDYDDNGKQRFVPWGLTCTTCGVIKREKFESKPTSRLLQSCKGLKMMFNQSPEETMEKHQKFKIQDKLKRRVRKTQGGDPISSSESGLRRRVSRLGKVYDDIFRLYNSSKDVDDSLKFVWNEQLTEQFLNLVPRPTTEELVNVIMPQGVGGTKSSDIFDKDFGYVPNPDEPGWLKYDAEEYRKILKQEAILRIDFMKKIITSRILI